jgi:hypothetical protein
LALTVGATLAALLEAVNADLAPKDHHTLYWVTAQLRLLGLTVKRMGRERKAALLVMARSGCWSMCLTAEVGGFTRRWEGHAIMVERVPCLVERNIYALRRSPYSPLVIRHKQKGVHEAPA